MTTFWLVLIAADAAYAERAAQADILRGYFSAREVGDLFRRQYYSAREVGDLFRRATA